MADVDGWPRTGEVEALARRARLDLARAGALGARGAHGASAELDGRRDRSSSCRSRAIDWLVREVLKEAGDAAVLEPADAREAVLARRRAPARAVTPRREPPRPDHDDRRGGRRRSSTSERRRHLRDERPRRLAAPDAALVRRPRRRAVGVDVREVAEGAQPRARPARTLQVEAGDAVRRAARRDARGRGGDPPRRRRRRRLGVELFERYTGAAGRRARRDGRARRRPSASRCSSSSAGRATLGPPQARRDLLGSLAMETSRA